MTKKKILTLALCLGFAFAGGSVAVASVQKANADMELMLPQEYTIQEEYSYGETFIVPAPSSVSIKNGTKKTAAVDVVFRLPDGTAKSEGSYTLDKTGTYEITYYNANGASVTETFTVYKNTYSVGQGAAISYVDNLVGVNGKSGVDVQLKDGTSFTYNQTVNLNDYVGDTLEICKIYPLFREDSNASPDASTVSIKLVDCFDSTKFVEFYIWCGSGGQNVYVGAGASTQTLTGLENNPKRPESMTDPYEGTMYKIHRPSRYQSNAAWGSGLRGLCNADFIQFDGVTLAWDLSDYKVKAKNNGAYGLVTDLDSMEIYDANVLDFESFFTTGEVYLNIEAYNYTATSFHFGIEKIFGRAGEELKNSKLVDVKTPEIVVDVEPTVGNTIYLQKGKEFTLPKLEGVFDLNYYGDIRVEIYRNYGKTGQVLFNVEEGTFVPTMLGNYTAVYTAIDAYGNVGKQLLEMVVLDETGLNYEPIALPKLVAAKGNVIPKLEASGLNKAVETSVFVTTPNGEQFTVLANALGECEFIPEYVGEYTVTYILKDNVYEETYSYSVECVDEGSAVFNDPFTFPSSFIKGASYTIPSVTAYTAGDGKFNENEATLSVSLDGSAYQGLSKTQMQSYKVEANQTLQFKATYGDNEVESTVYSVVDVGFGKTTLEKDYLRYMQGDFISSSMTKEGAEYVFDGDGKLQFINAISSEKFKLSFSVQAKTAENIVVVLRDVTQPDSNYIVYTYAKKKTSTVTLNAKQYTDGELVLDKTVSTKYKELCNVYTDEENENKIGLYDLSYASQGLTTGDVILSGVKAFEKDRALLEISVTGASEGCTVTFSKLNNQSFSTNVFESKPQMKYVESDGVQEIKSMYTISPCYASSVLCSVLQKNVTVTVHAPDGEIARSVDGVALEKVVADKAYVMELTQSGQYRVVYEVSCVGASRTSGETILSDDDYYIINVSEGVAPEIKFNDGSNTQTTVHLKVGSSHTIKEFSVTDNVTDSDNIKVYTMILDKGFMLEENGYNVTSYVFKNAGEFIVYVLAYDELGNSSSLYYNVIVS
ncbi:MAG: hypothetical protein IJX30_05555 [Clostridia bacterium]|nr:hypothetical protein [Clostridia bacterium]